jgi:hypothetical protein
MNDLPRAIATGLSAVQRPGDFYASGTLDMHPLRLDVAGIGPVALPLLPAQAEQLVAVAEQAPYGRGSETLVDTDVRRTWQLDATRVCISGRRWAEDLAQIVRYVAAGLGVAGRVEAELYKLLIYDAGSFVRAPSRHRKGGRYVRDPGRRTALALYRGRAGRSPQGPGGAARSAP